MKISVKIAVLLILVANFIIGCKKGDAAGSSSSEGREKASGAVQTFSTQAQRADFADSETEKVVKVADLEPSDVLVAVNGRAISVADCLKRLDFESSIFAYRHQNKPLAQLEGGLAKFRAARVSEVLDQIVAQYLVDDYLANEKVSYSVAQLEDERQASVSAFRFKGSYEEMATAFRADVAYLDEQLLHSWRTRLAREHFDPSCTVVTEAEVDAGLAQMEKFYRMAVASNATTYATCSNVIARLASEKLDFALVARQVGCHDLDDAAEWDRFEPTEIEESDLRKWAFSAPVGSVGGPFLLSDGLSVVKILEREEGTAEPSLASSGVAAVELARITFDYVEPEPEPRTREHVREALLEWKGRQAQKRLFETLTGGSALVFPKGKNLDFDGVATLKGENK